MSLLIYPIEVTLNGDYWGPSGDQAADQQRQKGLSWYLAYSNNDNKDYYKGGCQPAGIEGGLLHRIRLLVVVYRCKELMYIENHEPPAPEGANIKTISFFQVLPVLIGPPCFVGSKG